MHAAVSGRAVHTGSRARGHGVPCARYTYRGHGVTRDFAGTRGHGVGSPWARGRWKFRDFLVKFDGGKKNWGMGMQEGGRSTCYTSDPRIKINKNSQKTSNHKKIGMALFVRIFEIGQEQAKLGLKTKKGGSNFVRNHGSSTKMV